MLLVQSSMHELCVAQVWSVQMFLLSKYANCLKGASIWSYEKHQIALPVPFTAEKVARGNHINMLLVVDLFSKHAWKEKIGWK